MAYYSIFIPGASAADKHLESVGLGDLERSRSWDWIEAPRGPDGLQGVVGTVFGSASGQEPIRGIDLAKQKWVRGAADPVKEIAAGAWWYGSEPDRPPVPADLINQKVLRGSDVTLRDGNAWHIPEALQLPMRVGRDIETGEIRRKYATEYEAFCEASENWVQTMFDALYGLEVEQNNNPNKPPGEVQMQFELSNPYLYCCMALSLNYRVMDPIVGDEYLDLFDDASMANIVRATIAFPDILTVIEKKK